MASTLETLVVRLVADASKLEQELNKQVQASERASVKISTSFASAARTIGVFGGAAVGATTALVAFTNRAANYADQIDKAAIRTRLGRDTLQELAFAADQAGVRFEAIEGNIRAFTGRLAEAERGSAVVAGTFDRLGVALRDQNGALRDTEALFLDTITALSGVENETERAALAVQAFGETGSELLPFLSQGADGINGLRQRARDLGLVLDNEGIRSLVDYKDRLSEVQAQFGDLQRELAIEFLPLLTEDLIPFLQNEALPAFRSLASLLTDTVFPAVQGVTGGFNDLTTAFNTFVDAFESGEGRLQGIVGLLQAIQRGLGLDPGQFDNSVFFDSRGAGGGRGATAPAGSIVAPTGPDFGNPGVAFGPQLPPGAIALTGGTSGTGGTVGGGGSNSVPRSVADVFADLLASGLAANRIAQALGATPEALEDAARARRGFVEGALRELLTDFYDQVDAAQVAYLVDRLAAIDAEISALTGGSAFTGSLNRTLEDAGLLGRGIVNADRASRFSMISDRGATRGDGGLEALLAARAFDESPTLDRRIFNTAAFRDGQAAAIDLARLLDAIGDAAVSDRGRTRGDGGLAEAAAVLAAQALERSIQAFDESPGSAGARTSRFLAERARAQSAVQAFDENPGSVPSFVAEAARRGVEEATAERRAALLDSIGAGLRPQRGDGGLGDAAAIIAAAAEEDARLKRESALEFAQTIVGAGQNLAAAIKSGSPSAIGGALTGGIGSIISLFNPVAGGLFSIFGGLATSFLPDARSESEATRALGANVSGAPSVSINVTQNVSLAVASLVGAEARQAFDRANADLLRLIETNLVPRITRLEAAA